MDYTRSEVATLYRRNATVSTRTTTTRPSADELVETLNAAGSVKAAAEALGVNRVTVHDWIAELGIERGAWQITEEPEAAPA